MTLKKSLMSCVLVCAAIAGITPVASAQVQFGVVGDGVHHQYGPQDVDGNYMGVVSETYDAYVDGGFYSLYPQRGVNFTPLGNNGGVMLALNPYTGEVWTDVPIEHQAYADAGYSGHAPLSHFTGDSGLPDDPGTPDIDESIVMSEMVSTIVPGGGDYTNDVIYVTGELVELAYGYSYHGAMVHTSPDGGILAYAHHNGGTPVDGSTAHPIGKAPNLGDANNPSAPTYEVREYAAGDPESPNPSYDLTFDDSRAWGIAGWTRFGHWVGQDGGKYGYFGFEMDGYKGWLKLSFSGHRTGVCLTEYYFDAPAGRLGDFDGDGDIDADDIDALGAAIAASSTDTEFDMDGDGDVDADDFNMHVTTLVDTALGMGTGTAFGDFNLDGVVGILDLGLLGDGYNAAGGWASGDANGDGTIGILDLGLLGDNYGYDGSAIPEPATMSLLGLGAVAILRRRSR
jgi:hypothetical protein